MFAPSDLIIRKENKKVPPSCHNRCQLVLLFHHSRKLSYASDTSLFVYSFVHLFICSSVQSFGRSFSCWLPGYPKY